MRVSASTTGELVTPSVSSTCKITLLIYSYPDGPADIFQTGCSVAFAIGIFSIRDPARMQIRRDHFLIERPAKSGRSPPAIAP